ncbi:MAG TPA: hypothetical protein VG711_06550 [Phycisphaerales bacterium]|nr:hypothetical protein [Phycisphaerales bacterium]
MFVLITHRSLAQDIANITIEPRMDQSQFLDLLQKLQLSHEEQLIPNTLFKDYVSTITALQNQLNTQADTAGRQRLAQALSGKAVILPADLKDLQVAVLEVTRQGFAPADRALDDLLSGLEVTLSQDALTRYYADLPAIHRDLYLQPVQAQSNTSEYAGEGVDVIALVNDARAPEGELASLDPASLSSILNDYETTLDQWLVAHYPEDRTGRLNARIAAIRRDSDAMASEERARINRWQFIYSLNLKTVQQIGDVASAQIGPAARDLWLARFDHECFAWMFRNRKPDRMMAWIARQPFPTDVLQQAQTVYSDYTSNRQSLARHAIDVILRGRNEFHRALYSMMDPSALTDSAPRSLYEELLRNSGEQTALENDTAAKLEALVPADKRSALSDSLRGPALPDRRR